MQGFYSLTGPSTHSRIVRRVRRQPRLDISYEMLKPLKQGKPVVLKVDDPSQFKKKRVTSSPLLFLTPETVYKGVSPRLIVAYESWGCEIIDTRNPVKAVQLYRAGISYTLAIALAKALNKVFNKGEA